MLQRQRDVRRDAYRGAEGVLARQFDAMMATVNAELEPYRTSYADPTAGTELSPPERLLGERDPSKSEDAGHRGS